MQVVDVTSGRAPSVSRSAVSTSVFLTIDGIRNANVRDRETRLIITLAATQAGRLWRMLGEVLTETEKAGV